MISVLLLSLFAVVDVFDGKPIHESPLGYIRSVQSGISLKSSKYRGANLQYLDAEIGKSTPIIRLRNKDFDTQLGIEVGSWMVLGYYQGRFPLVTQDFLLAIPLMFRADNFSGAIKWNHLSSHRSDGFDFLWDKTLSPEQKQKIEAVEEQENVSISPPVKNYSRDFWSLEVSKKTNFKNLNAKSFLQLAYIHKIIPHGLGRWFGGNSFELEYFGFYIAENLMWYQDTNTIDFSIQTGWILEGHKSKPRVYVSYYSGSDRRGQFLGRTMKEYGLGLSIR